MNLDLGTCECCNKRPAFGAASIPGIPMTIVWCRECVAAGVIPYWAAVGNTAAVGGYANAAPWWTDIVDATLAYFDKDREAFDAEVAAAEAEFDQEPS